MFDETRKKGERKAVDGRQASRCAHEENMIAKFTEFYVRIASRKNTAANTQHHADQSKR